MWCSAMLFNVMSCYSMPCYSMPCYSIPCYALLCSAAITRGITRVGGSAASSDINGRYFLRSSANSCPCSFFSSSLDATFDNFFFSDGEGTVGVPLASQRCKNKQSPSFRAVCLHFDPKDMRAIVRWAPPLRVVLHKRAGI